MRDSRLIEDLRLLHPPEPVWALWLAGVTLALVLAWGFRRRRRRRTLGEPIAADPHLTAWEEALRELERLATQLRAEASRDYARASTAILRRYVERRYGLDAPRLTTPEFLAAARAGDRLPDPHREALGRFLEACDWMKFGRALAETAELQAMQGAAMAFLIASKPGLPSTRGPVRQTV